MTPFLEYVLYDIFGECEPITWRAMMGSYVLYYEGKPFAFLDKEELYMKGSRQTKEWYLERGSKQFSYVKKGEIAYLYYFSVPEEVYENRDALEVWMGTALNP